MRLSVHRLYLFLLSSLLLTLVLFALPGQSQAWPLPAEWIPVYKNGIGIQDPNSDAQGSRNIVSDPAHPAEFIHNDGAYFYVRLRLDQDPTGSGGQYFLKQFGWGVEFDTNLNAGDYEWLLMIDGISKDETISLQRNSIQGSLGDPGDKTESTYASYLISGNYQINTADTSINGDQDYFLDFRFPYNILQQAMGLSDSSPIRIFGGSSSSTNNLTENGADLIGGSDLYSGFSDFVTPYGTILTTGSVKFVASLTGSGDVTEIKAGDTIYIRVADNDRNFSAATMQTLRVTITTPGGDSETVTLTETGINTGIFTSSIISFTGAPVSNDGKLQVLPGETVTVTYIDGIDANLNQNQPRTDTLTVIIPPVLTVTKTVSPAATPAGGTITYTITITNSGAGNGYITAITDLLPGGFSYVTNSTSGATTLNPQTNGQQLNWPGNWLVPKKTGGVDGSISLSFQARAGSTIGAYYNNVTVSEKNFGLTLSGDTAPITVTAPLMNLVKQGKNTAVPGEEIIYSVLYHNLGNGSAHTLIIMDTVPHYTTYVANSLRLGSADSTYATATPRTDTNVDADGAEFSNNNIIFTINSVAADDATASSGPDEGKVYFKVKVD